MHRQGVTRAPPGHHSGITRAPPRHLQDSTRAPPPGESQAARRPQAPSQPGTQPPRQPDYLSLSWWRCPGNVLGRALGVLGVPRTPWECPGNALTTLGIHFSIQLTKFYYYYNLLIYSFIQHYSLCNNKELLNKLSMSSFFRSFVLSFFLYVLQY